ncbi:MAG: low molecular weight protein arginine phosphatase [Armatimonadetes bacterium]|nr:low molecular weight protein arginine phosphatase [Armatimonadota bacterium]MDW8123011.1 low molecular weight protein arginine phosphatase [Armatimonadota bacterium]
MAEGLLRQLSQWSGLPLEVRSAGINALVGEPATPQAVKVLAEMDINISDHSAQQVNRDLLSWADLVLTMTREQMLWILSGWPEMEGKVFTLAEFVGKNGDVEDPYGASSIAYRYVRDKIVSLLLDLVDILKKEPSFSGDRKNDPHNS